MGVGTSTPIRSFITLISLGVGPGDTTEVEMFTDENSASLVVSNIGSSGQDGVSITVDSGGTGLLMKYLDKASTVLMQATDPTGDTSEYSVVVDNAGVKMDLSAGDPVEGVDISIMTLPEKKKGVYKADNIGSSGIDGSALELGVTGGTGGDTVTAGRLVFSNIGSSGEDGVSIDLGSTRKRSAGGVLDLNGGLIVSNIGSSGLDGVSIELVTSTTGGGGVPISRNGHLKISNLGSSGQDGVSIDVGDQNSGATVRALTITPTFDTSGVVMAAIVNRTTLKSFYETGDIPTEASFTTTVDSSILQQRSGNFKFELVVTDNSGVSSFTKDVSGAPGSARTSLGYGIDSDGSVLWITDSLGDTTILLAQGIIRVIPPDPGAAKKFTFAMKADRIEMTRIAGGSNEVECGVSEDGFLRMIDSLGDTTVSITGRGTVAFRRAAGGGVAANRVEIADLNADGLLDLRVDGNVTVGTATAVEKLTVTGNICATGNIGACSDARYKRDIATLDNPMGIISKLRGVDFKWRTDEFPEKQFSEMPQVGFIAQEIKDILPGVVSKGADGYYSVDYSRLTPVLVEALKEQQKRIESQQAQIDELKSVVNRLVSATQTNVTLSQK